MKRTWLLCAYRHGIMILGPSTGASQVTHSAVVCGAEVLLVLFLLCRCDLSVTGDLNPRWSAGHIGPGDHGGEWLKLFWAVLAHC